MGNVPGSPWKNLGWVGPRGSQRSLVGVWGWEVMACGSFPERQNPLICGGGWPGIRAQSRGGEGSGLLMRRLEAARSLSGSSHHGGGVLLRRWSGFPVPTGALMSRAGTCTCLPSARALASWLSSQCRGNTWELESASVSHPSCAVSRPVAPSFQNAVFKHIKLAQELPHLPDLWRSPCPAVGPLLVLPAALLLMGELLDPSVGSVRWI